jgi:hypothetical protein
MPPASQGQAAVIFEISNDEKIIFSLQDFVQTL